jgi:hypothetical protein
MASKSVSSGSIDTQALEKELSAAKDLVEAIRTEMVDINFEFINQVNSAKELAKSMKNYKDEMARISTVSTKINAIQDDLLAINARLGNEYVKRGRLNQLMEQQSTIASKLENERVQAEEKKTLLQNANTKATIKQRTEAEELLRTVQKNIAANESNRVVLQSMLNTLDKFNDKARETITKAKVLARVFSSISKIPIIGPLLDASRVADAFLESKKAGYKELGEQVKTAFSSPVLLGAMAFAIFSKLFDLLKSITKQVLLFDENATNIANSIGISKKAAQGLLEEFYNVGDEANKLPGLLDSSFLSMTNAGKAMSSLQESFGTSAAFSNDLLQSQILLTEQMGLSKEDAAGIQKYFFLSNVNAKGVLDTITKQNRAFISYRKLIGEIANVNTEISAAYKNQPELLAKAAIEANKIGMSLNDTKKISDSLLNFESSIDGELKAELLTGKQLNFEKARALALDGKSAEAASELVTQFGGINQLSKLNVIQRKALAESIGLSSEELTKYAQQEEIIKKLGAGSLDNLKERHKNLMQMGKTEEANALLASIRKQENGEMLAQDIARATLNQRFEQSITRIKEIFVNMLSGPITGFLESFGNILKHTTAIKWMLGGLVIGAIALAGALTAAAVASSIASGGITALLGMIAAAGIGTAVVAGGAAVISGLTDTKVQDSVIGPSGNVMISTPRGRIVPDQNDSIITTTNPSGLLNGNRSMDTSKLESKLDELINTVKVGGNVYIDSVKSGTAYGMGYSSYA